MTMTLPEATTDPDVRRLLTGEEFNAVLHTIERDNPDLSSDAAARVLVEAIKFVATGALFPGHGMRPSRSVDKGWHALILHTATYAALCQRLGRFVHHRPDVPGSLPALALSFDQTQQLMVQAGFAPDRTLWFNPGDGMTMGEDCGDGGPCCKWCDPNEPKPEPKD